MKIDIVRAWKDPEYRKSLSAEELASVPECPTGFVATSDEELKAAVGGARLGAMRFSGLRLADTTLGGSNCKTEYPECCYNSTIGPMKVM
ncbi:mersacidin/lichenicidin family type 2 lantibiotic [Anaeromyxobacter terrae]|uniref:mersacidin/lichenicidin family type 2 lantibiotic n=1 Tax=Anaeromyxobacter terrae TaxID=2925406 RepID=UPI001F586783|nr:mersacidin/lichenicidin family type 2 lantibiotic [Anaeromyxobacter sp. SG22]